MRHAGHASIGPRIASRLNPIDRSLPFGRPMTPQNETCSGLQQMKPQLMKHLETPILM